MSSQAEMAPSASTVDRMVNAAVKHLNDCRITNVDVAEIARLAGVDPETAQHIFPDDDALDEAIGSFGIMKLSDAMNRALIPIPSGDDRAALIALGRAYVRFALDNRELSYVLNVRLIQSDRTNSVIRRYDAGFVPLVRRFLGESSDNPSRRGTMARAFLFGLTDLAVHGHLDLWKMKDTSFDEEIDASIDDFVNLLMGPRKE